MSVKVMNYSYFLKIISYINTYISVTYTEYTVRNVKPQGNHNSAISLGHSQSLLVILYCKVITTKETEKSILRELLVTLYRKVIQLVRNRPL